MVAEAESREGQKMKTVEFEKVKAGDLVEVPRTQFAPMRRGWNGWLFSEAVVIQKGISQKNKRKVIKVEMRTPKSRNDYGTMEKTFYAECVFQTKSIETARRFMQQDGVNSKEEFYEYRKVRNDNANKMYLDILEDESDGLYIRDIIRLEIKNNDTRIPRNISK